MCDREKMDREVAALRLYPSHVDSLVSVVGKYIMSVCVYIAVTRLFAVLVQRGTLQLILNN